MTPKCCQECQLHPEDCKRYDTCGRWLRWFRTNWAGIRRDAQKIKRIIERNKK